MLCGRISLWLCWGIHAPYFIVFQLGVIWFDLPEQLCPRVFRYPEKRVCLKIRCHKYCFCSFPQNDPIISIIGVCISWSSALWGSSCLQDQLPLLPSEFNGRSVASKVDDGKGGREGWNRPWCHDATRACRIPLILDSSLQGGRS